MTMANPTFDDGIALERLQPFFEYCKSLGDGRGEAEVMGFMLTIIAAINQEMKYDTIDDDTNERVQGKLDRYFAVSMGLINDVIRDLEREEETRRQEVINGLSDYQRGLLGLKKTEPEEEE